MRDYDKAMLHVELALRRACQTIREGGETSAEDALWIVAGHLGEVAEEERRAFPVSRPLAPQEMVCPLCGAPDDALACDNLKCPGTAIPRPHQSKAKE